MADDPDELVAVTAASGPMEAQLLKSALEGAGFFVLLQGMNAASIDTRIGQTMGVPVLVRRRDLIAAQALLSDSHPVLEGPSGQMLEGAVCPVHEEPAAATCDRCGTFLCARCGALGDPPVCEDCMGQEAVAGGAPSAQNRALRWVGVALIALPIVAVLVAVLVTTLLPRG
jgi:hypothetical protein